MDFPFYLVLPLASSVLYTICAMIFKKVLNSGVDPWFLNFIANIATCILTIPLLFVSPFTLHNANVWQPLCAGLVFMVGQAASLFALKQGDVSIATPLLGMKVLLVAVFTVLVIHQGVSPGLWAAAALTTCAFVLLRGPKGQSRKHFFSTVLYSLICAASFALCDVLIQKWAPSCGSSKFLVLMFISIAAMSIIFIPLFKKAPFSYSRQTWKWLGAGATLIAIQAIVMGIALSYFGNATAVNIVFSARGVWSVLIVWWFGAFFDNKEKDVGKGAMLTRLVGSGLLFAAIALAIIKQ